MKEEIKNKKPHLRVVYSEKPVDDETEKIKQRLIDELDKYGC